MKRETVAAIRARIELCEGEEMRIAMTIRFPPPGCRTVLVWSQVQTNALCALRKRLVEDRRELFQLTSQLELGLQCYLPEIR